MTLKDQILSYAAQQAPKYKQFALDIHAHPETSNHEYFAQELLTKALEEEGFEVQKDIAGHPTGFIGTFSSGKPGPVIAFLAEYDALTGIGHACGHNLFGPTSLLAAAALKQVIRETGGEIRVYGTPGEEGGENACAKVDYTKAGLFNDADVALCAHPGSHENQRTGKSLACAPIIVEFFGKASHAAAAPEKGINALDALIQVFNSINALRQHVPSDVKMHGIITKGGDAPNIVPEYTQGRFFLRAATLPVLRDVYAKVQKIVEGAALATGAKGVFKSETEIIANFIETPMLDQLFGRKLEEIGEVFEGTSRDSFGSTDVGNVSQVVPTIQPMLKISDTPVDGHSLEKKAACASETGLRFVEFAAKAMALTALDLLTNPELLAAVKKEHQEQLARQAAGKL